MKKEIKISSKEKAQYVMAKMSEGSKNMLLLFSLMDYCYEHPNERFWQALRNWAGVNYICAADVLPDSRDIRDTFHWESRTGIE